MTMINGKIVVKDGRVLTLDSIETAKNAHKIASDIVQKHRKQHD